MKKIIAILVLLGLLATWAYWRYYLHQVPLSPVDARMPPLVEPNMETILGALEFELQKNQAGIGELLLPGISEARLAEIEAGLGFPINPEVKALYRWHDGLAAGRELFPGYEFLSLEQAVQTNADLAQAYAKKGLGPLMASEATWLIMFPDPAGDGYYYDYRAEYPRGGIFFNFRESGYFIYFPSLRNLLSAIIDCYRQGVYKGTETTDFAREQQILQSYGQEITR
jgi:cell wall assembly regulator SMI1